MPRPSSRPRRLAYRDPKGGVRLEFTPDREVTAWVRNLQGARLSKPEWVWVVKDGGPELVDRLRGWGFDVSRLAAGPASAPQIPGGYPEVRVLPASLFKSFGLALRDYQRYGVSFIESRDGRCLLTDEMGLGKTAQVLAWMFLHPEVRVVVVCPASLKDNWRAHLRTLLPERRVVVLYGHPKPGEGIAEAEVYVVNFEITRAWTAKLRTRLATTWLLVIDECHALRNPGKQTRAVLTLGSTATYVIGVSGTPIVNRPIEFFNTVRLIDPELFPSRWDYGFRFCGLHHNGFQLDFSGSTRSEELHAILTSTVMLRREKSEVLADLPAKQRVVVAVPMDAGAAKDYTEVENALRSRLKREGPARNRLQDLGTVERLKQIVAHGKLAAAFEWIDNYLYAEAKLVVFAYHLDVLAAISTRLRKTYGAKSVVHIDGSTPTKSRFALATRFQTDPEVRVLVGGFEPAGVGLDLFAASATLHLEFMWTPGEHDQAEDRVHRIGQTAESVFAYYLAVEGTIEERVIKLLDAKRRVLSKTVSGRRAGKDELLGELLAGYTTDA